MLVDFFCRHGTISNAILASLSTSSMPIRFFCDHCRQMLKIGTSKMGSVVDCPRCHKPVVVPPQSVPQAEQLYQILKNKRSESPDTHTDPIVLPVPNNTLSEPTMPESAWNELGDNVDEADLNQWIDELWTAHPANRQESDPTQYSTLPLIPNPISGEEIALSTLQKRYNLTVTLLYVSSAVALFIGILFGILIHAFFVPSTRPHSFPVIEGTGANEVTGTLFYRNENGDRWADVDAAIIFLPMDRPTVQLFSPQGLRPEDKIDDDTVQLIQERGGMYARADASGSFTLPYQAGTRYFVVLISAHQMRTGEIKPSILQELRRYFRNPELFGENCLSTDEYEWFGGKHSLRHTFELGE